MPKKPSPIQVDGPNRPANVDDGCRPVQLDAWRLAHQAAPPPAWIGWLISVGSLAVAGSFLWVGYAKSKGMVYSRGDDPLNFYFVVVVWAGLGLLMAAGMWHGRAWRQTLHKKARDSKSPGLLSK